MQPSLPTPPSLSSLPHLPAPLPGTRMPAVLQRAYGGPEVLEVGETEVPALTEDGVLVRVVTAGVNKGDWHLVTGTPHLVRLAFGLTAPSRPIVGMAIAGQVVAVGAKVTGFQVGERVFAEVNRGGFAAYACVPAKILAHLPDGVSFEDAATLPVAATTAFQPLRDAKVQPGQSVLINGASGGVGSFAVQIAKAMGAKVTGVCSAANGPLVKSLGADRVVDYGTEDFTRGADRYDIIFDLVGNYTLSAFRGVLAPGGRLLAGSGGGDNNWVGPMFTVLGGMVSNLWSSQPFVPVMNKPNAADLQATAAMVVAGTLRPVIDRRYTLGEVPEAIRYLGLARTRGKCIVTV